MVTNLQLFLKPKNKNIKVALKKC